MRPKPGIFLFTFILFTRQWQIQHKMLLLNWTKRGWCAWDSNPGCKMKGLHGAMAPLSLDRSTYLSSRLDPTFPSKCVTSSIPKISEQRMKEQRTSSSLNGMPVDNSNNCSCCYYNKRNWKLALQFWGSKGRLKLKIILDGSIHWRREWHRQKTFSQVFYVKDCSYIHCQFIWYDANRAARFIINLHRYLDGATQNVTKVSFSAV